MNNKAISFTSIKKISGTDAADSKETLAVEEPLEIRIKYGGLPSRLQKVVSVTMRTPGNDTELALGFLFTEGIIKNAESVVNIYHEPGNYENVIWVEMNQNEIPNIKKAERNFYTTSSCGVCGKTSIASIRTISSYTQSEDSIKIAANSIYSLPQKLRNQQNTFEKTGGLHACALFDVQGNLLLLREDVGRHNAMDKLVGAMLTKNSLPLTEHILLLSGRASFELIQKAIMAGIKVVAAIGAPSSMAVEMATEWDITLIGFLRGEHFNLYTGAERIVI